MPLYRVKIEGRRKPVLLLAESQSKALGMVAEATPLTSAEKDKLFETGEQPWKAGTPLPADDAEPKGEGKPEGEE